MFRTIVFLFALVVFSLFLFGSVAAQDVIVTNTPALEPTVEPTLAPVVDVPPVDQPGTLAGLLNFVVGAITGAVVTLTGTFAIIGRIKNDKPLLDLIEALGKSAPADLVLKLNELGKSVRDAGEVIDVVTDGQPNVAAGA